MNLVGGGRGKGEKGTRVCRGGRPRARKRQQVMGGSESSCLGAVEARTTEEAGGWLGEHVLCTVLHQPLWLESDPTGWAHPPDPALSLNVEARVGQDQGRAEVTREVGQKNPSSEGEGGFRWGEGPLGCGDPVLANTLFPTASLTSTATAGPCLRSSPLPGTQPSRPRTLTHFSAIS